MPALVALAGFTVIVLGWPEYGIALAVALSPLTNLTVGGAEGLKPLQLLLPALAFGSLLYGALVIHPERRGNRPVWLAVATLFLVGVTAASAIQAIAPSESINDVMLLLTASALFFAVLQICQEQRQLVVVLGGAVVGLLVGAAHGVAQQLVGESSGYGFVAAGEVIPRVAGSFGHPNQYGGFIAFLIPVAGAVLLSKRFGPGLRAAAALAIAFALPALTLSYVRGAIVGLVVGTIGWLGLLRPKTALLVALGVVVAAVALAPSTLEQRFRGESSSTGTVLRVDIWKSALAIYEDYPVLGAGVSNFSKAYERLPPVLESAVQRRLLHQGEVLVPPQAQNLYLHFLAEEGTLGMLAFVLWAGAAVAILYRSARSRDPFAHAVGLGVGAGVATFAVHSLFEASLLGEIALPLFALLGVAAAALQLERDPSEPEPATSG